MKHSFWGYFVVVCGLVIVVILLLVQRMTTTSEEDFYLAREVLESSMIDAVDYGTYRTTGRLVMSEQKFVEVFIRRFSESVTNNKTYELDFYDIYEEPPKASVKIRTSSGNTANIKDTVFDVNLDTLVSGILETIYSQADGDSSGGNSSGDTTTVACPNGGHKTIHYTPNIPDGEDGEGDEIIDYDPDDLLMSSVINLYSVGYAANKDAYNKDTKTCSGLSITGGADYKISYKALPNGLGEDIVAMEGSNRNSILLLALLSSAKINSTHFVSRMLYSVRISVHPNRIASSWLNLDKYVLYLRSLTSSNFFFLSDKSCAILSITSFNADCTMPIRTSRPDLSSRYCVNI